MIGDYFKIAWRNLTRHKFNTIISVAGLTLGLTCFLIILAKTSYETGFDRFHSGANRIWRVVRVSKGLTYLEGALEYRTGVFFGLPGEIKKQIPELEAVTQVMYTGGSQVRILDAKGGSQQAIFKEEWGIAFLEPEFFDVFDYHGTDFHWISGSPGQSLTEPFSAVLTETLADKYFGDEDPIGKIVRVGRFELQVKGIVSEFPQNSDFPFQLLISLSTLESTNAGLFTNWGGLSDNFQCYVKAGQGTDPAEIERKIKQIHAVHTTPELLEDRLFKLQPLAEVHNDSRFGNYNYRVMSTATVLSLITIGVLLIIIACINYSNLTVAQLSSRAKVAGICKVLGSNRKRLMMQFFSETFILTSAAMVFSLLAADRILKSLNYLIGVPPGNWSFFNPVVLLFLLGVVALVSTIAGLYPAFLISKANPVAMIRNKGLGTGKGGLRFSRATVIFQFIIAQILIVCTLTIFGQLSFIESKDMGYDRDNILTVAIPENNAATLDRFGNELLRNADITQVSFASTSPGRSGNWVDAARNVDDAKVTTVTEMKSVDSSYIYLYGLELVSGRNFKAEESGLPVIVNQKLLEDLQFEDESQAIGAKLEFRGEDATIIGVVRDFHSDPIYQAIRPCVLEYNPGRFNMAGIKYRLPAGGERFRVRIEEMVDEVRSEWQALFPGQIFEYQFFDETIASYYREEKKVASLINIFTGIMLFICCLGIVGLIYHTTDRRSKELAVRKVVGASVLSIVTLLVRSFTNWVLVANLVAWPVAYLVMDKWLQNFAYRIDITWRIFVVAGFSALAIAILTMTAQVIRAALANPVESLRYE